MAESATQTITIAAPPNACFGVATDFEHYPEWANDVKDAKVVSRDDQGRAREVEFRASALGRSTHYTLHYDYSGAPERLSWKLSTGDVMRACDEFIEQVFNYPTLSETYKYAAYDGLGNLAGHKLREG